MRDLSDVSTILSQVKQCRADTVVSIHMHCEIRTLTMASQQTKNICITFVQRRPNIFGVGPTLLKCYTNVLCLLGYYHACEVYKDNLGDINVAVMRPITRGVHNKHSSHLFTTDIYSMFSSIAYNLILQ